MAVVTHFEITSLPGSSFTSEWVCRDCDDKNSDTVAVGVHGFSSNDSDDDGIVLEETDDPKDTSLSHVVTAGKASANAAFMFFGAVRRRCWRVRYLSLGAPSPAKFRLIASGYSVPPLSLDGSGNQTVMVAGAIALPSGAATAARQDTGNNTLSSIDGKLPTLAGGRLPVDAGVPEKKTYTATASSIEVIFSTHLTAQAFTIHNPSSGAKRVRIVHIEVTPKALATDSTTPIGMTFEVVRFTGTTPPSGGTGIQSVALDPADSSPGALAVLQTLPTTLGSTPTEGGSLYPITLSLTTSGSPLGTRLKLYKFETALETKPLTLRSTATDGYAIRVTASDQCTLTMAVTIDFTEDDG